MSSSSLLPPNIAAAIAAAIYKIQLALYEPPSSLSSEHLLAASPLLSRPDYNDVVTERNISLLCGYPLCSHPLPSPSSSRRPRYRISLRNHQVFDLQDTYKYCSEQCLISSRAYAEILSEERTADITPSKVGEILAQFRFDQDLRLGNSRASRSKLEIREREVGGEGNSEEWIGPSNAIEGYVPRIHRANEILPKSKDGLSYNDNDTVEEITKKLEERIHIGEKNDGTRNPSFRNDDRALGSNDQVEEITKKLEERVLIEEEVTTRKPSEGVATVNNVAKQRLRDHNVDFPNDSGIQGSNEIMEEITKLLEGRFHFEEGDNAAKKSSKSSMSKLVKKNNGESDMPNSSPSIGAADDQFITAHTSLVPKNSKQTDFTSTIIVGDMGTNRSSNELQHHPSELGDDAHLQRCKQTAGGESKDSVGPQTQPKLKSSLKTSGERNVIRSVKWADEGGDATLEEENYVPDTMKKAPLSYDEMIDGNLRFVSAEACAAALTQASEAIASGLTNAYDAVSEAGIVILPQTQHVEAGDNEEDAGDDAFEFDHGYVKWPKKTVLLDTDMFEVDDSWHDTPPEGFNLNLSSFATMWMALFEWISCSSLAYIYGHDEGFEDEYLLVNGREYPHKVVLREGKSSEIRKTFKGCISRAIPDLVLDLKLPVPVSALATKLDCLLDTMTFVEAIPSFKFKQWQVIVLLFLEALSVNRLPSLTPHLTNRDMLLHKVLKAAGIKSEEYEAMRDLIMPLGRFPDLSMQRGG